MARRRAGTIEQRGDGLYRVRARVDGRLRTVATGLRTLAEAELFCEGLAEVRHEQRPAGVTVAEWGLRVLDARELRGVRSIQSERNRWRAYVASDPIGELMVGGLTRRDCKEWLGRRHGLAAQTQRNALSLLRIVLRDAVDSELLATNPAEGLQVARQAGNTDRAELEGVLRPEEQRRLLEACSDRDRPVVLLALLTGLRQSELWHLEWADIDLDRRVITVRRSRGRHGTKSGHARRVPMLPTVAQVLGGMERRSQWVCPAPRGGRRADGKTPTGWHQWQKDAGLGRFIRWHDLRHTCATSLLAGWWGHRWSLEEVRGYLGHSTVRVTERYARLVTELAADAAHQTTAAGVLSEFSVLSPGPETEGENPRRGPDSNRCMTVLQTGPVESDSGNLEPSRSLNRLQLLATLDPDAARPGLAVTRGLAHVLSGDVGAAVEELRAVAFWRLGG